MAPIEEQKHTLESFTRRASRYQDNINLDGRLDRDEKRPVRGGYAPYIQAH